MSLPVTEPPPPESPDRPAREFGVREGLAFAVAMVGVQLSSELITQWGTYFYSPPEGSGRRIYVSIAMIGVVFGIGRFLDVLSDPLIGAWSDATPAAPGRFRLPRIAGRRRPFVFWGAIGMTATGIWFWHPPVEAASPANFWFAAALVTLHWTFFTFAYVPLHALAPEVARSDAERVRLGGWIAAGMTFGLAASLVLPGVLVEALDPARAIGGDGERSPAGYQRVAAIFAVASLACFLFLVFAVKERFRDRGAEARPPAFSEMADALRNRTFLHFFLVFFVFQTGYLATQRVLPYWAEIGLGGSESTVTLLALPFVATCLGTAFAASALFRRFTVRAMLLSCLAIISFGLPFMHAIGAAPFSRETKIVLGAILFGVAGVGQGLMYVILTPMIGRIVDMDARRCGRRREAVYNGFNALSWKGAQLFAIVLSTQSMALFGASVERPHGVLLVGPVSGILGLIGLALAWKYPTDAGEDAS